MKKPRTWRLLIVQSTNAIIICIVKSYFKKTFRKLQNYNKYLTNSHLNMLKPFYYGYN